MLLKAFSVFDSKAKVFAQPFFTVNTGTAIRSFTAAVNDPSSDFSKYPEDFSLFEIGAFDDNTGMLSDVEFPINLGLAAQFKAS